MEVTGSGRPALWMPAAPSLFPFLFRKARTNERQHQSTSTRFSGSCCFSLPMNIPTGTMEQDMSSKQNQTNTFPKLWATGLELFPFSSSHFLRWPYGCHTETLNVEKEIYRTHSNLLWSCLASTVDASSCKYHALTRTAIKQCEAHHCSSIP